MSSQASAKGRKVVLPATVRRAETLVRRVFFSRVKILLL